VTLPELLSGDVACQHWSTGIKELNKHRRSGPAGTGDDDMVGMDKKYPIWQSLEPLRTPLK
jgi:hypothetical protein